MKSIHNNWIVMVSIRFSILLLILSIAVFVWRWQFLPPLVPLWYSKPWGTEQLAHPLFLLLLPLGTMLWFLVDVAIIAWQGDRYRIFTQALFLATFLVSFLSSITLIKIIFLVS